MQRMPHPLAQAIRPLVFMSFVVISLSTTTRADLIRPSAALAFPDLSGNIVGTQTYNYDSSTHLGTFAVNNAPALIALGPQLTSEYTISDPSGGTRSQSIQLTLDSSGQLVNSASNSYKLYGSVTVNGTTFSGLLLEGTPTQFGFANPNPQAPTMSIYDMNMTLTGGLLKDIYGPDAYVRIITETNSTFDGTFNKSFMGLKPLTNVRGYNAPNPSPIPEPSTLAMLLTCGGIELFRRRRNVFKRSAR